MLSLHAPILPDDRRNCQALHRLQRYVANNLVSELEDAHGSTPNAAANRETKLVEAKLEMVRAVRLLDYSAAVSRVRWINTRDRLQRDEIDRCLQGGIGPRQG